MIVLFKILRIDILNYQWKVLKLGFNYKAFIILTLGAGTVFKLSTLKDVFYIPMQDYMHLTNTQIGVLMSIYGLTQAIGNIFSIYIANRFSKKIVVPLSLIIVGCIGLYVSTLPDYRQLIVCWILFAIFGAVIYWPILLKSIRLLVEGDIARWRGFK